MNCSETVYDYSTDQHHTNQSYLFIIDRSKALLVKFLSSESILKLIGEQYSTNIITFLRNYVFPHEDYFASYHYHKVRCFHEHSNTPLEGTNNAVKHSTFGVKGNMSMSESSVNIVQQDNDKLKAKRMHLHAELHKHRLCDLDDEGGRGISKEAFGQLMQEVKSLEDYASLRTSRTTWNIIRSVDRLLTENKRIPVFERIRCVCWNSDGSLTCSCGYTDRWGMPCRHISHVVQYYTKNQCCFTHHDVDIRWWNIYAKVMAVSETNLMGIEERSIYERLRKIRDGQQGRYPIIQADNMCEFPNVQYKCGTNSLEKFTAMDIISASLLLGQSTTSTILNYPECNEMASCSVGISETVYFGDDCTANEAEVEVISVNDSSDNCSAIVLEGQTDTVLMDDNADDCCTSVSAIHESIAEELEAGRTGKPIDAHFVFGPLYREISRLSKGDSNDDINATKTHLESVIYSIKERQAGQKAAGTKSKAKKGALVSCTTGNTQTKYVRFSHKKQKLF